MSEGVVEVFKKQIFPDGTDRLISGKERLVSTYRPIEIMFAVSGKEPNDFKGKSILNVGAGKTHWGFELTKKYGVVAAKFDSFDISYAEQSRPRRLAGKLLASEWVGNIKEQFPFHDESYDLLWCSWAPENWGEFIRVTKPGGKIFVLGGYSNQDKAKELSRQFNIPVTCENIDEEKIDLWKNKVSKADKSAIEELRGQNVLVATKPKNL